MWRRNRKAQDESKKALKDAKKVLHEIKSREPEIEDVVGRLKQMRDRNHFAEQIQAILESR